MEQLLPPQAPVEIPPVDGGTPPPGKPRRRRSPTAVRRAHQRLATDALMLAAAGALEALSASSAGIGSGPFWRVLFALMAIAILAMRGAYKPETIDRFLDGARVILSATAVAAMLVIFLRLLVADDPDVAEEAMRSWLFASFYLIGGRAVMGSIVSRSNRLREAGSRTLILGAGEVGHLVARRLLANPELGLRPVGFIDSDPADVGSRASGVPILGTDEDIDRVIIDHGIEHAVISFSRAGHEVQLQISRALHALDVSVSVVPRLFEAFPDRLNLDRVAGLPLITVHPSNPRSWPIAVKYACDRVAAGAAILLASPLLLFGAIGTAISLGRPILFRQRRVGLDGREFDILKFRTMPGTPEEGGEVNADWAASAGAEEADGSSVPDLAPAARAPTRFGAMMRRYSLDELPQLFNVLRGQMSLVGPRPELPSYVATFEHQIRRYNDRHRVKAGITGWAQVNGLRGNTSLHDRVEWDNYYIENWSMWLDLKILMLTATAVFREPGK